MKKNTVLSALLVLLVGFTLFSSCEGVDEEKTDNETQLQKETPGTAGENPEEELEPGTFPGLDLATEKRIIQDGGGLNISGYYGTYNGVIAVMFVHGIVYLMQWTDYVVAGNIMIPFVYPDSRQGVLAWKEGNFYLLQDACDSGLLTLEDIKTINALYNTRNQSSVFIDEWYKDLGYYGRYNGIVALIRGYDDALPVVTEEYVAGDILFVYPDSNVILAWGGKMWDYYSLQHAYDLGLLTREDIETIRDRFNNRLYTIHNLEAK